MVSVDAKQGGDLPQHPRLTYVEGPPHQEPTVAKVREALGGATGLLVLGSRGNAQRVKREFDLYREFVAVGSYAIVEDTILNGHPVFPGFGPGPFEGAKRALQEHGDFVADSSLEKHGLTFNPGGFLRRVR